MDKKAVDKARSRLRVATKASQELGVCKSHDDFTDTWYTFLTASKNIYTILEQGAKSSPQSRQWFGERAAERRGDELLQYVYEARNDDEHGLEPVTTHDSGGLAIGVARPGFSNSITVNGTLGPGGVLHIQSNDGHPVLIEDIPPHTKLATIRARGGRLLGPPSTHLGRKLPNSDPQTVAGAVIVYLSAMVQEAEERAA